MLLSKRDKRWLRKEIRASTAEAVMKALTVEMTWEKVLDEKTGLPLAVKEVRKEQVFLPAFWTQHLKHHEGVYRGMRKTLRQQRDKLAKSAALNKGAIIKLEQVRKVFVGLKKILLTTNRFTQGLEDTGLLDKLENALSITLVDQIEDKGESTSG